MRSFSSLEKDPVQCLLPGQHDKVQSVSLALNLPILQWMNLQDIPFLLEILRAFSVLRGIHIFFKYEHICLFY